MKINPNIIIDEFTTFKKGAWDAMFSRYDESIKVENREESEKDLAKGEVGWGNLNDFGQEGEDITNL